MATSKRNLAEQKRRLQEKAELQQKAERSQSAEKQRAAKETEQAQSKQARQAKAAPPSPHDLPQRRRRNYTISASRVRQQLSTAQGQREAWVLHEVLGRPVSQRRRH